MVSFIFNILLIITVNSLLCESYSKRDSVKYNRMKRSENFKVPEISFYNTFLDESEIAEIKKEKLPPVQYYDKLEKYPFYNKLAKHNRLKHSPLRYAEDVRNIPKKTTGGSEFYDSKDRIYCSEVPSNVDPVPDRIKSKEPPEDEDEEENQNENDKSHENESDEEETRKKRNISKEDTLIRKKREFEQHKKQPRLKGLGDHLDCFKEKYFGREPLDNPFFDEDVIEAPDFFDEIPFKTPHISPPRRNKPQNSEKVFHRNNLSRQPILANAPQTFPNDHRPNGNFIKKKPGAGRSENEDDGEVIYGTHKETVDLPEVLFSKYLRSEDPRVKVYGDVMGNIRANLGNKYHEHVPNVITHVLGHSRDKYILAPNRIPININPERKKESSSIFTSIDTLFKNRKPYGRDEDSRHHKNHRFKRSNLVYHTIGRKERQAQHYGDVQNDYSNNDTKAVPSAISPFQASINSNVEQVNATINNHRKFYTPITTTNSISPDQLKIEYILRAAAELQQNDEILNKTLMLVHKNTETPYLNVGNIRNHTNIRDNSHYSTTTQNPRPRGRTVQSARKLENIFDVSAYLPKPIFLSSFDLNHNNDNSNKYLDASQNEQSSEDENNVTEVSTTPEDITNRHEDTTSSVAILTSPTRATEAPNVVKFVPIPLTENIKVSFYNDKPYKPRTSSSTSNGRRRGRIYTTTTTEPYIIFPPYPIEYSTVPTSYKLLNEQKSTENEKILLESTTPPSYEIPKVDLDLLYHDLGSTSTTTTERYYETSKVPIIRVKHRNRKPKRIKRPFIEVPKVVESKFDDSIEDFTRSPTILQKTSTKRKTTLVTNSRRYDDEGSTRDYDNLSFPESTTKHLRQRGRPAKRIQKITSETDAPVKISLASHEQKPSPRKVADKWKEQPAKETKKIVEDYQEEEITRENVDTSEEYGPELAKKVNDLSEPSDQESREAEGKSQENSEEDYKNVNILKTDEDLDKSILDESQPQNNQASIVEDDGISARVLRSFVSLFDMATTTQKYEIEPGERLYFYLKLKKK